MQAGEQEEVEVRAEIGRNDAALGHLAEPDRQVRRRARGDVTTAYFNTHLPTASDAGGDDVRVRTQHERHAERVDGARRVHVRAAHQSHAVRRGLVWERIGVMVSSPGLRWIDPARSNAATMASASLSVRSEKRSRICSSVGDCPHAAKVSSTNWWEGIPSRDAHGRHGCSLSFHGCSVLPVSLTSPQTLNDATAHDSDVAGERLRGELDAFAQRREDVHRVDDVVHRQPELHGERRLVNQVRR